MYWKNSEIRQDKIRDRWRQRKFLKQEEVENCVKCYWKSSKNTGFSHVEVTGIYDRITFSGMVKVTAG